MGNKEGRRIAQHNSLNAEQGGGGIIFPSTATVSSMEWSSVASYVLIRLCDAFVSDSHRRPRNSIRLQVSKVGDDEEAIPENHGMPMNRRQKSKGSLFLDGGHSFEEDEEDEGDDNDRDDADNNNDDGASLDSSTASK